MRAYQLGCYATIILGNVIKKIKKFFDGHK